MSNIYITEPNTEGKVLFHTSFGEIDVELWPKQAPKACRNFVQLCLEKYYDNTYFHRLIPKFMIQGGDPTSTGKGGESVYGEPFIDEFHSRLKFNHRGILAMANENKPNSNHSQFFFTFDSCEFLNKKHTIFGKITGNTIFNLLSIQDNETDANDRPLEPLRLKTIEVLWNPFDDIVPRITKTISQDTKKKKKKRFKGVKDYKLLSFGEEAEEDETLEKESSKKIKSSHDVLDDPRLRKEADENAKELLSHKEVKEKQIDKKNEESNPKAESLREKIRKISNNLQEQDKNWNELQPTSNNIKEKEKKFEDSNYSKFSTSQEEYMKLREELRRSRKQAAPVITGDRLKQQESEQAYHDMLTPLQRQRQKFLKKKKTYGERQKETLEKLKRFQTSVQSVKRDTNSTIKKEKKESYHGQVDRDSDSDEDTLHKDLTWMATELKFKKHIDDQYRAGYEPSADQYMTIDTRNSSSGRDYKYGKESSKRHDRNHR